ncbi:hypothetical protein A9Z06_00195 [Rhizobium sp. YK2]|nr:hypothetical protein A9Z06_00195 [Rhizobium sp. YK2]
MWLESAPALRFIYLFVMSFKAVDNTMVVFGKINNLISCDWSVSPRSGKPKMHKKCHLFHLCAMDLASYRSGYNGCYCSGMD